MNRIFIRGAFAAAIVAMSLSGSAAHASERTVEVAGVWQEAGLACIGDGIDESNIQHYTCTGLAIAEGGWTGIFKEKVTGALDLNTGNSSGTSTQEFTGLWANGGVGTITMKEDFTIDKTMACARFFHGIAAITGGTGDFAGSSGHYEAYACTHGVEVEDGLVALTLGVGEYTAYWTRP